MRAHAFAGGLVIVAATLAAAGCDSNSNPIDPSQANIEFTTTDLVVGTGAPAANGNTVTFNYTGWLFDPSGTESKGRQYISSAGGGPQVVTLGRRQIVPGVEQALLGMRLGGKRRAYIPSNLAYGASGTQDGTIPPNAAIVFELEVTNLVQ